MQIEGLNKTQRALADIMWGMDSKEQVTAFISSLRGQQQREAQTVLELMLWAIWDECGEIATETKELIDSLAR